MNRKELLEIYRKNKSSTTSIVEESYMLDTDELKISSTCYETFPCEHHIILKNEKLCYDGPSIKQMLIDRNLTKHECYKHFQNSHYFDDH
jgi:hypothetical protein